MTFPKKISALLSLAAALSLSAHGQDAQAKFTLPYSAHLGAGVLPAGEYKMTLSFDGLPRAIITPLDGKGRSVLAVPMAVDSYAACSTTSVTMLHAGAKWNVRSVCFAEPHLALYFPAPGESAALASAAEPATIAGSR